MEIIGGIQVSGSVDIYEGVLRTIEASGSFSGSGRDLYDIPASAIVGLVLVGTGSVTASVNQTNGFVVNSAISGSTFTGSVRVISGSFSGSGAQLYDIPFSGLTGDSYRIASGSATASIKIDGNNTGSFHVNTEVDITGSLYVSGSLSSMDTYISGTLGVLGAAVFSGSLTQGALNARATGLGSHAEGSGSLAQGIYSHAEGQLTTAGGQYTHAEGRSTIANANYSHAEGFGTQTAGLYQHAQGTYNIALTDVAAFMIGNGASALSRSNLMFASGNLVQITGSLGVIGSSNIVGEQIITGSLFMNTSNIYVNQPVSGTNIFGTASHADSSSYTLLAQTANVMDGGIY